MNFTSHVLRTRMRPKDPDPWDQEGALIKTSVFDEPCKKCTLARKQTKKKRVGSSEQHPSDGL